MMMQHKRGSFWAFKGQEIEIREFALAKAANASRSMEIRISHVSMAAKRIADENPELAGWFCLKIAAGREIYVEDALKKEGVQALVPTRKGEEMRRRGRVVEARMLPVLPGYVLVRCVPSAAAMAGLRRFDKVIDVVGSALSPFRVPEQFVNKFIEKVALGAYDHREPDAVRYSVNEAVRIIDGPFASFDGFVVSQDVERNRVDVEIEIFGRATPVDLDVAQIEKV
jgi:transcriptional antiterminator NusG